MALNLTHFCPTYGTSKPTGIWSRGSMLASHYHVHEFDSRSERLAVGGKTSVFPIGKNCLHVKMQPISTRWHQTQFECQKPNFLYKNPNPLYVVK